YLALEPDLRQRWPHRIISWSRLLAGRWRDPLVGRDLLVGGLFSVAIVLVNYLCFLVPEWMGLSPAAPRSSYFDALLGGRRLFGVFFNLQIESLISGLGTMILVLLSYLGLRREWLAVTLVWLLLAGLDILGEGLPSLALSLSIGLGLALFMIVLMRYGLLAGIA